MILVLFIKDLLRSGLGLGVGTSLFSGLEWQGKSETDGE